MSSVLSRGERPPPLPAGDILPNVAQEVAYLLVTKALS